MLTEDVITLTPAEYAELSAMQQVEVHKRAQRANQNILDQIFQGQVDWVMIAGAPGKVIAQGTNAVKISDDQIAAAERATGAVCFFYTRPDVVEEVGTINRRSIGPFIDASKFAAQRGKVAIGQRTGYRHDHQG